MKWKTPPRRYCWDLRIRRIFAILPKRCLGGATRLFESLYVLEQWCWVPAIRAMKWVTLSYTPDRAQLLVQAEVVRENWRRVTGKPGLLVRLTHVAD